MRKTLPALRVPQRIIYHVDASSASSSSSIYYERGGVGAKPIAPHTSIGTGVGALDVCARRVSREGALITAVPVFVV